MREFLWLIPALPLLSFLVLIVGGKALPRRAAAIVGTLAPALSAIAASVMGWRFMFGQPPPEPYAQTLWTWVETGGFSSSVSLYLDPLAVVMTLVVTWISFLILLYSVGYMAEEHGFRRFFAYMNLFVGSMLVLVLADDLLLLYLGWEGVGLCSYLLIGFWYGKAENRRAAIKAFVVTRVGDAALAVGLFLIFYNVGTLGIREAMGSASAEWIPGSLTATIVAALLLAGALGKSAQLPLHTWLPDAMAGPTPVSALIHAATMVAAGVYLIARTHVFFSLAPMVLHAVAIIGALTLLVAGSSAVVQRDIKRALAYSTMSQIGYMFLALGVGAWIGAIFHFVVHAFVKALLFLSAGVLIQALHEERDILRMGGLRTAIPVCFWTFLIGSASLSAVPFVTAGFFSKELILAQVWASPFLGAPLALAGLTGGLLTSLYSFRLLFYAFFGEQKTAPEADKGGRLMALPLAALAVPALVIGFMETPRGLGSVRLFSDFLAASLPAFAGGAAAGPGLTIMAVSSFLSLVGIWVAYAFYSRRREEAQGELTAGRGGPFRRFLLSGWAFDRLYDACIVKPLVWAAQRGRDDFIDLVYQGLAAGSARLHRLMSASQSGRIRRYAMAIALGAVIIIGIMVLL